MDAARSACYQGITRSEHTVTQNPDDWKTHLRTIDWLDDVTDDELDALPPGRSRSCTLGQVIFSPSPAYTSIFFCIEGLVRIHRLWPDGAEMTLGYVSPGQVFGEFGLFDRYPRESYAMAATQCTVCELPIDAFRAVFDNHRRVAAAIAGQIAKRLKRVESRVANLVFRDAFARMCATLVELGEDFGNGGPAGVTVDVPLTQSELATLVGTSRQTVNAGLRKLEDAGVMGRSGQRFVLLDTKRLIELGREGLD
jgi:CRP/FNR family cyclic AMP-dependent transcriptional regulator